MTWNLSSGDMVSSSIFVLRVASIVYVLSLQRVFDLMETMGFLLSTIFNNLLHSLWASFVWSPCLIFLVCVCQGVSRIPVSAISHDKQLSSWKYTILPWYMHILYSGLSSSLKRNKIGLNAHGHILKGWRAEEERLRGFGMCSWTKRKKEIKVGNMVQV